MASQSTDQKRNQKNENERLRRFEHSSILNKLSSLMVLEKMGPTDTDNSILRTVMAYIVRKMDSRMHVNDVSRSTVSNEDDIELPVQRLGLIAWTEDEIDIVDYDIDQDWNKKSLCAGSKLSDYVIFDPEIKHNLKNALEGLDPWHVGDFGPFECKSKDDLRTVAIQGKIIRGEVYNRNKRGAENEKQMAISKRLKITHLPSTEIKNSPNIDRQLTCKYPSYSAGLSLKHGYFTWFSENFTTVTGISQDNAIGSPPNDFLHSVDGYFNNIALKLWTLGMWNKGCFSRLKKGNSSGYNYIRCEITDYSSNSLTQDDTICMTTTIIPETEGRTHIENARREITNLVLQCMAELGASRMKTEHFQRVYNELHENGNCLISTISSEPG